MSKHRMLAERTIDSVLNISTPYVREHLVNAVEKALAQVQSETWMDAADDAHAAYYGHFKQFGNETVKSIYQYGEDLELFFKERAEGDE